MVTVTLTATVPPELSPEEIEAAKAIIVEEYDDNDNNVEVDVAYVGEGTVETSITPSTSEDDIAQTEDALENVIAEYLNIHPNKI